MNETIVQILSIVGLAAYLIFIWYLFLRPANSPQQKKGRKYGMITALVIILVSFIPLIGNVALFLMVPLAAYVFLGLGWLIAFMKDTSVNDMVAVVMILGSLIKLFVSLLVGIPLYGVIGGYIAERKWLQAVGILLPPSIIGAFMMLQSLAAYG